MPSRYGAAARYLHWVVAGLILVQFVLADWAESAEDAGRDLQTLALLAHHKSVGMTVLMLATIRLLWRWRHPAPPLPASMPRWQTRAAHAGHGLLYGLLFAMPITGWLMSSASAYSVSWFNLFTFPDLIGGDPARKETFESVHEALATVLYYVALGHIAIALWHQVVTRDGVLLRMATPGPVAAAIGLAVVGLTLVGTTLNRPGAVTDAVPETASPAAEAADPGTGDADAQSDAADAGPAWQIDYGRSHIRFSAKQAGASFEGRFAAWRGDIRFDPANLPASRAAVTIDLSSVETGDDERDQTLGQPAWFGDRSARFRAGRFEALGDGRFRTTDATLDFGSGAHPVTLTFGVERRDGRWVLDGTATLDRLALNVGTGEWRDTTWVGQFVDVAVHVDAQ